MDTGLCTVMATHTSCSLTVNENAEPRVLGDLAAYLRELVPQVGVRPISGLGERRPRVNDDEGRDDLPAHIRTALTCTSRCLPFHSGRLLGGTWLGGRSLGAPWAPPPSPAQPASAGGRGIPPSLPSPALAMAAQPPTPAQIASLASDLEEWTLREGKLHRLRLHGPRGPGGRGDGSSPGVVQRLEPGDDPSHHPRHRRALGSGSGAGAAHRSAGELSSLRFRGCTAAVPRR